MKTPIRVPALMLLGLGLLLSACTFEGALKDQFYRPTGQTGGEIPLKVGLIVDENEQAKLIRSSKDIIKYDIKAYPGVTNAMAAELATLFKDVVVVKNAKQAGDAALLAHVTFEATENMPHTFSCQINLKLQDAQTRMTVANYQHSENVAIGLSGGAMAGAFLTGFTLFAGAPVFMPMAANSQGEHAVEVFEAKIPGMIRRVTSDIGSDQRITAFASGMRPGQPPAMVASVPARAPVVTSDVDRVPEGKLTRKNAYAIVVGIEQYRQKLPKADYATHDAQVMNDYLIKTLGLQEENVALLTDDHAARTDLVKYVENWLPNRVEKGDSVFIYFSGHGAPNPKTGEAYVVPYDGDPAYIDTTGYPLKRLYEQLAKLPAKEVVVMLDSCFSGAGGRSVIAKGMRPMGLSAETPVEAKGKTVVLAASSGDQVSSTYDKNGHGLFTYFLLKGLQGEADGNKDGSVDLQEVFDYLKPQVERIARREYNNEQTPQLLGNRDLLAKGVPLTGRTR
jgi:hypothetical protein